AEAFKTFRDEGREQFLLSLVPLIRQHLEEFDQASADDRLEEFMSPLDQDDHWSGLGEEYHHQMRKEIDWHLLRYIYPPGS
ncbi:MAG TPA: hypothetical protein VD994_07390, partial [Prosthecobacter sp.]|nr:hypothetical protein [Prosthecobacter sp.]